MVLAISKFISPQFWVQTFQSFLQTCRRFPLVLLCLVITSLQLVSGNQFFSFIVGSYAQQLTLIGVAGVFWFLAAALFSESHHWTYIKRYSLALPVFALGCWHILVNEPFAHSTWTLFFAIALSVTFAAYLFRKNDNASFWYFNFQLTVALCFAMLSALILCAGLSLSLKYRLFV